MIERGWEIDISDTDFEVGDSNFYQFICYLPIMGKQTMDFLQDFIRNNSKVPNRLSDYKVQGFLSTKQERVKLNKVGTKPEDEEDFTQQIETATEELNILSTCLDLPMSFYHASFRNELGNVYCSATRRDFIKGIGFSNKERKLAKTKIENDFDDLFDVDSRIRQGIEHYSTGQTILNTNNPFTLGKIDAAFMQFYQGAEILAGNNYKQSEAKKYIARKVDNTQVSEKIQIILAHVWKTRHLYFGHGNTQNDWYGSDDYEETFKIAKQVLVVRWLCRKLIDMHTKSNKTFAREQRIYFDNETSVEFRPNIKYLQNEFPLPETLNVQIFDNSDSVVHTQTIH
jgi:hypothetical protein